jgi:phytoene synthase
MTIKAQAGVNGLTMNAKAFTEPSRLRAGDVIRRHSRSFSIASRLLPSRIRGDVERLYAWCRTVDDAVDESTDEGNAWRVLEQLETDLDRLRVGESPLHPASNWIEPLISKGKIDVQHAKELISGMRMDVCGIRVKDRNELLNYCYHAAGTVGLMMTRLMGVSDRSADKYAIALGIAMQLTNIARDVKEDALRGRSYLPGVGDPLTVDQKGVQQAVRGILETAEQNYRTARQGLIHLPTDCRLAIRMAIALYREIGREIARRDHQVTDGRTTLPRSTILMIATDTLVRSIAIDAKDRWDRLWVGRRLAVSSSRSHRRMGSLTGSDAKSLSRSDGQSRYTAKLLGFMVPFTEEMKMGNRSAGSVSSVEQAKHAVYLGLSLTAIMATALFVMVFVNPKDASYSYIPLVYSAGSLLAAILFNRLATNCEAKMTGEIVDNCES